MNHVFHRHTRTSLPLAVAGDGPYVIDDQGKRYLDASGGAAVSCLGHSHPAVIDAIKRQLDEEKLRKELIARVRETIGPVAAFKLVTLVQRLPKTRSGKVLRGTMKKIADGEQYKTPATIDDPAILEEISTALEHIGYPRSD